MFCHHGVGFHQIPWQWLSWQVHQVESHDRFRAEIDQLLAQGNDWDDQFRELVATFLTEWLTRHVFGIDKELEAFIFSSEAR